VPVPRIFTTLQLLIGLAAAFLVLAGPAAAWTAHDLSHGGLRVAADVHHHHDEGGPSVAHPQHQAPAEHDDDDGGHDHMPSLSAAFVATLTDAPAHSPPALASTAPIAFVAQIRLRTGDPPPARPPRFG
jgi:hypothetical protein